MASVIADANRSGGPLRGLRILEISSIGPGPLCGMFLADLGAEVLRIDRVDPRAPLGPTKEHERLLVSRGRRSVCVDLKQPTGVGVVLRLVERADALIEGFRPGTMERLGLGPDACLARNRKLVYGRVTGWGQDGPLAQEAGHDINYIALAGVLSMIGRRGESPTPPLNLVGDGGGGGLLLALGVLAALLERDRSGRGQVVDAAMVEGAAALATAFFGFAQLGGWSAERGTNLVDSGAPFYDAYETSDGRWLAVGAIEPVFYASLLDLLGLAGEELPAQHDRDGWPLIKRRFAAAVATRTLEEWTTAAAGTDACVAPVLQPSEVLDHEHLRQRGSFVERDGMVQPAPAPRFSRTEPRLGRRAPRPGEHTAEALRDWGLSKAELGRLLETGAVSAEKPIAVNHPESEDEGE